MEQEKLPNVTTSLVLAILSFIGCCCTSGIGGLILSGIALFLTKKDEELYQEAPENYHNYSQLKTAKTVAIIGLVLSSIILLYTIYTIYDAGGWSAYQEKQKEAVEQIMNMLE